MSIVLVIIGLLVGGILTGKSLMQQAEIRNATSQLQTMETAYNAFRLKYNCIVGDCPNATDFFGANYMAGISATACNTMTNGLGNGDENGFIDTGGGGTWSCEDIQAIRELVLSTLLPASKLTACWNNVAVFKGINDACAFLYKDDLYNAVTPLSLNTLTWAKIATDGSIRAQALSPVQARLIDEKLDDGNPTKGKFRGLDASTLSGGAAVVNSCVTSGVYNLNEDYTCRSLYYFK